MRETVWEVTKSKNVLTIKSDTVLFVYNELAYDQFRLSWTTHTKISLPNFFLFSVTIPQMLCLWIYRFLACAKSNFCNQDGLLLRHNVWNRPDARAKPVVYSGQKTGWAVPVLSVSHCQLNRQYWQQLTIGWSWSQPSSCIPEASHGIEDKWS